MNLWKTAIATLCVAFAFTACHTEQKAVPSVSLAAGGAAFVNGEATVLVNLSTKAPSDVKVVLEAAGTLPDSNLEFEKSVTVPKGSSAATVSVKVKPDGLEAKSYDAVISIVSVTNGELGSPKSVTINYDASGLEKAVVNIDADSEFSAENKATVTISLRKAAAEDVSVKFAVGENVASGKTPIPAEALSFTNPAVVPAGSKELELVVTVDPTKIVNGKAYQADLIIESVSSNAKVGTDVEVFIDFRSAIVANLRNDWSVTFKGEYEKDGDVYHDIEVDGVGENGTYYIFVYEKGVVAANFATVSEYLDYMEVNAVGPAIGTEDAYRIKQGETGWLYQKFPVGEYEIWLAGCDETGHLTGDYNTSTFEIEPTAEMKEAYEKFLGEWQLSSPKLTWTISQKTFGSTYIITGIEGLDYEVIAYLNEDLELEIYAQSGIDDNYEVTYDGSTYNCEVGLYGIDNGEGYFWTGEYLICTGSFDEDGNIVLTPGTVSDGTNTYSLATMIFIAIDKAGNGAFSLTNSSCGLPNMLINPNNVEEENTPVVNASFDDFIGSWVFGGYVFEISAGSEANTYVFSAGDDLDAVAKFEEGKLALYDQTFGSFTHQTYGACTYLIGGIFKYGSGEYLYYVSNNDGGLDEITKIFSAELHESGNITLVPGSCKYGDYIAFRYRWIIMEAGENQYKGNWLSDPIYMDGIVKPYVPADGAPKGVASKQRALEGVSVFRSREAKSLGEGLSTLR